MASADPPTSIPVHTSTLRLLQEMKTGAQTWDDFLRELAERDLDRLEHRLARMDLALFRAGKAPVVPLEDVLAEFRLQRRK